VKLIVGLGNPGPRYTNSRHNIGFRVVDQLAHHHGVPVATERFLGVYGEGFLGSCEEGFLGSGEEGSPGSGEERERLGFLKPTTFMNRSGGSVAAALAGLPDVLPERDLLIVYDDLDLPLGRIRLRPRGGDGGHNGISDVIERLGTRDFARLRFGIGRPAASDGVIDFVLDPFSADEEELALERIPIACEAALALLTEGAAVAMDRFNADPGAAPSSEAAEASPPDLGSGPKSVPVSEPRKAR
jgi:PTH1 family peptidyl-tRNA hydrolase